MRELERALVSRAGVFDAIEPAQQLRVRRVQIVVAVELEGLHQSEPRLDLARFGEGGGPVELHDRRAGAAGELAVQGRELRPVLGLVDVQGRDPRLQHVGIAAAERQRALERGPSLRPLVEVPERALPQRPAFPLEDRWADRLLLVVEMRKQVRLEIAERGDESSPRINRVLADQLVGCRLDLVEVV
jgi:hypothetical protein